MNRKRTTNRATRLFTIVALITLLLLAAASPVHADGTWTNQPPPRPVRTKAMPWPPSAGTRCSCLAGSMA